MWGTSRRWVPSGPALCAYGRPGTPEPREWELIDGLLNRTSILKSLAKDDLRDPPYHDIGLSDPAFTQLARRFSGELFRRSGTFARRHLAEGCPLLVAGGCGLDCDWNSAWKASGLFADVFVPPCANDTGSAIGTAVDAMRGLTGRAKVEWSVYAGAGSIGLQVVRERGRIEEHVDLLVGAVEEARRVGKHEFEEPAGFPRIVAEEMTVASTRPWFDAPGYGDFVSVEGLVRDGDYHPLAMTGRFPTIEPCTELGNVAPCQLSPEDKARIVPVVRRAADALRLEDCATHTELELLPDGFVSLLGTVARMGGVAIAPELEVAFDLDYVGLYMDVMLGRRCAIPAFEASPTRRSAASPALIAADSRGRPWPTRHVFAPDDVDWPALAGPDTTVRVVRSQSTSDGDPFAPYDVAGGVMNSAGQAFLESRCPAALLASAYRILDGLDRRLPRLATP